MAVIRGPEAIRDAYRDERVAGEYLDRRFVEPLGNLLHRQQAGELARVIRTVRPRRLLEIAPGPARLTTEIAPLVSGGTLMDASSEMLDVARRRLAAAGAHGWSFVKGDAFNLPFHSAFDLVYTFRLIRHFEIGERQRLYAQIRSALTPGGTAMFDVVNERVSAPLRAAAPQEYRHYDALLRPHALKHELEQAGLALVSLCGVQHQYPALMRIQTMVAPRSRPLARLMMRLVDRLGGEPLEWVVTCRRA